MIKQLGLKSIVCPYEIACAPESTEASGINNTFFMHVNTPDQ